MFKGLFGKKEKTYTEAEYKEAQEDARAIGYDQGYDKAKKLYASKDEDLNDKLEKAKEDGHEEGYTKGYNDAKEKYQATPGATANSNQKLNLSERKKVKKLREKLLDDLDSLVRNTNANSVRGSSIVKEGGKIKVLEISSKNEALDLIKRAKDGEIKIVM